MSVIRLAIVGAGRMGALHAANVASRVPGAELAIVDALRRVPVQVRHG